MRFAVACLFLGSFCPMISNAEFSVFLDSASTVFSEPVPIALFEDDLEGGEYPQSGRHAVTFNHVEIGMGFGGFELAYFMREDYAFDFSEETFELIYRDKNELPIAEDQSYQVYLKAQHIKADGWRLGYRLEFAPRRSLRFSVNYMKADELLYGTLAGEVTVDDGDINGGNLAVLYYYHEDYLLGRRIENPASGTGYSADLEADIELVEGLVLTAKFHDIIGEIHWDRAPYSDLQIASTTTYYDEDGYARRNPMMTGKESYRNIKQPLPLHYEFNLKKQVWRGLSISYNREQYDKVVFNRLIAGYSLLSVVELQAGYDFTAEAIWLGMGAKGFLLQFAADDYRLSDSSALALRVAAYWRF